VDALPLGGARKIEMCTRRFNVVDSTVATAHYDDLQQRLEEEWPNYPPINRADQYLG
jgi:hypothetical protein